ncbi:hypothetical protein [Mesorhizobium sangaii]|uniref:Uncharacterized protein n=1 Tax=Mesorhizobium sangaii TaxID=505389 RepID=A0A841NXN3_9HYPH|nr:hypothetical protein [Mesorhizobium sangaii]MBB6407807.1 hypothetical protein [Mesorhizobium sangaii]
MNRHARIGFLAILFATTPGLGASAGEATMKGADILATLKGAHVEGPDWSQSFDDGGATIYTKGGTQSPGRWMFAATSTARCGRPRMSGPATP